MILVCQVILQEYLTKESYNAFIFFNFFYLFIYRSQKMFYIALDKTNWSQPDKANWS